MLLCLHLILRFFFEFYQFPNRVLKSHSDTIFVNPLKMMKNDFYFMLKALFVLEVFTLFSDFLVRKKNSLMRKPRFTSKFVTSQTRQQIITIHKLSNISRSKGNEAMKFGQIVKYSARNVFFQNSDKK